MAPAAVSPAGRSRQNIVGINAETVTNTTSPSLFYQKTGNDGRPAVQRLLESFSVEFHRNDANDASFSLIGIDASIANAFRRILNAEVPSLAIENVYVAENDSVIADEVLASRLGLVPLTGSISGLHWLRYVPRPPQGMLGEDTGKMTEAREASDIDTIVLKLDVECNYKAGKDKATPGTPEELYEHSNVYASDLQFEPKGRQVEQFAEENGGGIRPVHPKILLTKLRDGDRISLECHAVKGIGADHAKFSPVAIGTYRLLPTIDIIKPILGQDAKKFARCFPRGVISVEEVSQEESDTIGSNLEGKVGEKKAVVKDTMKDTVSRECLRHQEFDGKVKLGRVRDHFIFAVESTGQIPSDELFIESVRILRGKCRALCSSLDNVIR